jgi:LacI family transcriptional regulator
MPKRVTMQQIAEQAGVSKYAVSKALSGQSGVSEETRERIVKIAMQLGYFLQEQPPQAAKSRATLRRKRQSNTIVVLMPNVRSQHRGSPYWGRIVDGIMQAIRARGLGMVIVTEHSAENLLQILNPSGMLGVIGVGMVPNPMLLEIHQLGIPFVLVDHEDPAIPSDCVFVGNLEATQRLTHYLIAQGHTDIQFVGDLQYAPSFKLRWLGFRMVLEENGIPVRQDPQLLRDIGMDRAGDSKRIAQWARGKLAAGELPSAFVCANDEIAISTIHALHQLGLRVPDDVSVTGFDDIDDAIEIEPKLTTVRVDKEQMGARAVDMLLRRVEHAGAVQEKLLLAGTIVFRESVAACTRSRLSHV